jgi:Leu/Phe-tRNA-protein transferase
MSPRNLQSSARTAQQLAYIGRSLMHAYDLGLSQSQPHTDDVWTEDKLLVLGQSLGQAFLGL